MEFGKVTFLILNLAMVVRGFANNQIVFSYMGETSKESAYAHLVIPLNITDIQEATDQIHDLVDVVKRNRHSNDNHQWRPVEVYNLERMLNRINILTSLVEQGGFAHEHFTLDAQNEVEEALQKSPRARRSVTTMIAAATGLAAFGSSIFNQRQIGKLNEELGKDKLDQQMLIELVHKNDLRISNLTSFVNQQQEVFKTFFETAQNKSRWYLASQTFTQVETMLMGFRFELTDFFNGIQALMEHRLSPLLIEPAKLEKAYQRLNKEARNQGLTTLNENTGFLFQTPVSTIRGEGQLYAIAHIPLYNGKTLHLYRYIQAPFFLSNETNVVVEIESHAQYLAVDNHHLLAKEMTSDIIGRCEKFASLYHCRDLNLLTKDVRSLCLYNLYSQSVDRLEDTCNIRLSLNSFHAVQLAAGQFRLLSTEPRQLVIECKEANKVETIWGVHLLNLTAECPKASTAHHYFTRTTNMVGFAKIVTIPLLTQSKEWIGRLSKEFDKGDIKLALEEMTDHSMSIPIQQFKRRLEKHKLAQYYKYERYAQSAMMYILFMYLAGRVCLAIFRRVRVRRNRPGRNELSRVSVPLVYAGSASDQSCSDSRRTSSHQRQIELA